MVEFVGIVDFFYVGVVVFILFVGVLHGVCCEVVDNVFVIFLVHFQYLIITYIKYFLSSPIDQNRIFPMIQYTLILTQIQTSNSPIQYRTNINMYRKQITHKPQIIIFYKITYKLPSIIAIRLPYA